MDDSDDSDSKVEISRKRKLNILEEEDTDESDDDDGMLCCYYTEDIMLCDTLP